MYVEGNVKTRGTHVSVHGDDTVTVHIDLVTVLFKKDGEVLILEDHIPLVSWKQDGSFGISQLGNEYTTEISYGSLFVSHKNPSSFSIYVTRRPDGNIDLRYSFRDETSELAVYLNDGGDSNDA